MRERQPANEGLVSLLKIKRKTMNMSQQTFWGMFGVTQAAGSRIEKDGKIPPPLGILLKLYIYGYLQDDLLKDLCSKPA